MKEEKGVASRILSRTFSHLYGAAWEKAYKSLLDKQRIRQSRLASLVDCGKIVWIGLSCGGL